MPTIQPSLPAQFSSVVDTWFFDHFGGGWRFSVGPRPGTTEVVWRYNFSVRPAWLAPLADRIGRWLLGRDIRRRIQGYARGCNDDVVLAAAREAMGRRRD